MKFISLIRQDFLIIKILSREINYVSNVKTLNIPYIFDAVFLQISLW